MKINITFESLPTDLQLKPFLHWLFLQEKQFVWSSDCPYIFSLSKRDKDEYTFSHLVLSKKRNAEDGTSRFVFHFVHPNAFDRGGFSEVFDIVKTLECDENLVFSPSGYTETQRIVKRQDHSEQWPLIMAQKEYEDSLFAEHLQIEPPFLEEKTPRQQVIKFRSYLAMKKMPGRLLYAIIKDDWAKKYVLSIDERLHLIQLVLNVYWDQALSKNVVLDDIKSDNFLVDKCGEYFSQNSVGNAIDFFGSKKMSATGTILLGEKQTRAIICTAPELLLGNPNSIKACVWSIAKIILALLQVNDNDKIPKETLSDEEQRDVWFQYIKSPEFSGLDRLFLEGNLGFGPKEQIEIKCILKRMLAFDPNQRITLLEAMQEWEKIAAPRIGPRSSSFEGNHLQPSSRYSSQFFKELKKRCEEPDEKLRGFKITPI